MRAMIMPGVTIGEGAVVASGTIVTKDVAPYTIVAGNPAAPIRQRFLADTVKKLLELDIYKWPDDKFDALKSFISANDIEALVVAAAEYDQKQGTTT